MNIPLDKCALCNKDGLAASIHFLPEAAHSRSRFFKWNVATGDKVKTRLSGLLPMFRTLICTSCETRIRLHGEEYFMKHAFWEKTSEKCLDWMPPALLEKMSQQLFSARNLTFAHDIINKQENISMMYFATSVFWKSCYEWPDNASCKIPESLREKLQKFLLEPKSLPSFRIITTLLPFPNDIITFPIGLRTLGNRYEYFFFIEGYCFTLLEETDFKAIFFGHTFPDGILFNRDDARMCRYRQALMHHDVIPAT